MTCSSPSTGGDPSSSLRTTLHLFLILWTAGQLIPSTNAQGVQCYDCSYPRTPYKPGDGVNFPCHLENPQTPSVPVTSCPTSYGCVSIHIEDGSQGGAKIAWGFGSCQDFEETGTALHCVLNHPEIELASAQTLADLRRNDTCEQRRLNPQHDFQIRSKCLGEQGLADPGNGTDIRLMDYWICPCLGNLCRTSPLAWWTEPPTTPPAIVPDPFVNPGGKAAAGSPSGGRGLLRSVVITAAIGFVLRTVFALD